MSTPTSNPATGSAGSRDTLRTIGTLVWSTVVWVALWGDLSAANVLAGMALGGLTILVLPLRHRDHRLPIRLGAAAAFGGQFLWALVKASAVVAWEVVTPTNDIHEGIIEVPLRADSPGLVTLVGNAVSLTPGTLTLEARAEPPTLWVHVLHLRDIDDVREDIRRLEAGAIRAFAEDPAACLAREETR